MGHRFIRRPRAVRFFATLLAAWAIWSTSIQRTAAQVGSQIPSLHYFNTVNTYHQGEYRLALESMRDTLGGGIQSVNTRWIDSICYYTMLGECYYQMGRMGQALDQYTAALNLYAAYHDWLLRVQFPATISPVGPAAMLRTPWGQSKRGAIVGKFRDTMMISQGNIDNSAAVQRGGAVQSPVLVPIHVAEIIRCTTLSMRRRRDILGPACRFDKLTSVLLEALTRRPGPVNHWSEAWVGVQLGIAYSAAGNTAQATTTLRRAVSAAGQFDHPFTAVALHELGKLAMEAGNLNAAAELFAEATYAAGTFLDLGLLEESFRLAHTVHMMTAPRQVFGPLAVAADWAKRKGYRQLYVSLTLSAAESMACSGNTGRAAALTVDARASMTRAGREMAAGALGARANYVAALTSYQMGNVVDGDQSLAAAMNFQKLGSLWLYHIAYADRFYVAGGDDNLRVSKLMYDIVLRDPTPLDWALSPMECLAVLAAPHSVSMENWFEAALARGLERNELNTAVDIADRARRHRFLTSLPLGGRLLALRWLLEGPSEMLDDRTTLQRQELLVRYPKYKELSDRARELRNRLADLPLVQADAAARKQQAKLWSDLAALGQTQEIILREMAVRREASDLIFPPQRSIKDVQASLPKGHALLVYFQAKRNLFGFMYTTDKQVAWRVQNPTSLRRQLAQVLQELGNYEANHAIGPNELEKPKWQQSAARLSELAIDRSKVDLAVKFDELTIVPDGVLWYLPFEILPIGKVGAQRPLISQVRMRYAPTVGLTVPYTLQHRKDARTAVVVGKLHPQQDAAVGPAALERLAAAIPGTVPLAGALPAPSSLVRLLFDALVVLDDIEPGRGAYEWSPAQVDRGKTGWLPTWFALPFGGPERIILPGFHTAAESALRGGSDGSEVFLSVCGLMATGARTVLISRWRSGGQTSYELVHEFAQELPGTAPAEAWQRSVQLVMEAPLDLQHEPRLKKLPKSMPAPKADHPFFWAGYMLVDTGTFPLRPAAAAAPPPLNFKEKAAAAP